MNNREKEGGEKTGLVKKNETIHYYEIPTS
jgi:hypothetical protein